MIKKLKSRLAMVCASERTQRFLERRTPKVGFLFIPKSKFMHQLNQSNYKLYACAVKEFQRKPYCPPQRPYTRQLTVSYLFDSNNVNVPFIRLSGKWLKDAGFSVKNKVHVTVKDNLLVLEAIK